MIDDSDWIREVPGHPNYFVTSFGQVWSLKQQIPSGYGRGTRTVIGDTLRRMKASLNTGGYLTAQLDGRTERIHLLVLKAFATVRPPGLQARHLDGNQQNNDIKNLVWGTIKENRADRDRHGNGNQGEKHPCAKLTADQVREIRELDRQKIPQPAIAARFGITTSQINAIIRRKAWKQIA